METDKIISFMESLIDEGQALDSLAQEREEEREGNSFTRRYKRWSKNVVEVLGYTSMTSHFLEAKETVGSHLGWDGSKVPILAGIVESAYDLTKHGFVGKIKFLLHAEMFYSIAQQAAALNGAGHTIPAAVLGRIAIENWLRDQAERAGIEVPEGAKAASVNELLKKASILSVPRWRQIQALLDIGNSAAHGKTDDFSQADVSKLLEFVETNCT